MATAMIMPKKYFFDRNNNPLAYGKVYTYQSGTTNLKPTYTTENATTENTNPVILNGEGYADIYLTGSYSIVVRDAEENDIWTEDPVSSNTATEWSDCQSVTYDSPTSFIITGVAPDSYGVGRAVRLEDSSGNYFYSYISDSSLAGSDTKITILDPVVSLSISSACSSIFSSNYLVVTNFETYAELDAIPAQATGSVITVTGEGIAGDWVVDEGAHTANIGTIRDFTNASGTQYLRRLDADILNVRWFNIVGDGITDNTTSLLNFAAYAVSLPDTSRLKIYYPAGTYLYATSPNWGYSNISIYGDGARRTVLKCTGAGRAFNIDPSVFDLQFRYNVSLRDFTIEGNSATTSILYLENLAGSNFSNIDVREANSTSGVGFDFNMAVSCVFTNLTCGINAVAQSSVPSEGLRVSASPSKLQHSTNNIYDNLVCEGSSLAGIRLLEADNQIFTGGAAQANAGRGVLVGPSTRLNSFIGFFCEYNGAEDILDEGRSNKFINCSTSGVIVAGSTSRLHETRGGLHERLQSNVGAVSVVWQDLEYNAFDSGAGGVFDSGTATVKRNLYDFDLGAIVYTKKSRTAITVTATPFTYTNTSGGLAQVLIRGGNVTQVLWGRGGDLAIIGGGGEGGATNGAFLLQPNDTLTVSYSAVPTLNLIPMGVQAN